MNLKTIQHSGGMNCHRPPGSSTVVSRCTFQRVLWYGQGLTVALHRVQSSSNQWWDSFADNTPTAKCRTPQRDRIYHEARCYRNERNHNMGASDSTPTL